MELKPRLRAGLESAGARAESPSAPRQISFLFRAAHPTARGFVLAKPADDELPDWWMCSDCGCFEQPDGTFPHVMADMLCADGSLRACRFAGEA